MAEVERKRRITTEQGEVGGPITFSVKDAEGSVTVAKEDFPAEILARFLDQGIVTKVSRFTAGKPKPQEALKAIKDGVALLKAGTWSQQATGIGPKLSGIIMTLKNVDKKVRKTTIQTLREQGLITATDEELKATGLEF